MWHRRYRGSGGVRGGEDKEWNGDLKVDFSWFGITAIDIVILIAEIVGFVWLSRRITALEQKNREFEKRFDG